MTNTYNLIYFYQKTIKNAFVFIGSSNITPCPLYQAVTCHLLQCLIYKAHKKAFMHLFPIHYSESLYLRNLVQHGSIVANRGRDEHRNAYSKQFKVLNKALASTTTLLLLKPLKWSILNKLIAIQYIFTIRVFVMQTTLKILVLILQKTYQLAQKVQQIFDTFFKQKLIPKPNDLAQKNGERIKELIVELEEEFPNVLEKLEQSTDFPVDSITYGSCIYPVKEKNNPKHFWDIETIKEIFKQSSNPKCPVCREKLEFENEVDTNLQAKTIKLLEEAYNSALQSSNNSKQ